MSWEQQITEKLRELQDMAVRFDQEQELTGAEKARARTNIDLNGATVSQISGDDYKIIFS